MTLEMRCKLARESFEEKIRKVEAMLQLVAKLKPYRLSNRRGEALKKIGTKSE
jgi:hypothetical protein